MMKKVILFVGLVCSCILFAQEKNKIIFGGNISADLGRFNDRFEITPTAHTKLIKKVYLGIGATLAYYKQQSIGYLISDQNTEIIEYDITTKTTYYGLNVFTRFFPFEAKKNTIRNLYIQAEFEYLNGNGSYKDIEGAYKFKTNNKTLFMGFGYRQLIAKRFALNANLLFKLNNERDSPYRNPIVRIGFEF